MTVATKDDCVFLNVDVVVEGHFDRAELLDGLGESVVVLQDCQVDGAQRVVFESTAAVASSKMDPSVIVRELVGLVERLPPRAREAWDAAGRRLFDLGFEARGGRRSWAVDAATLAAVMAVRGEIAITVYA